MLCPVGNVTFAIDCDVALMQETLDAACGGLHNRPRRSNCPYTPVAKAYFNILNAPSLFHGP